MTVKIQIMILEIEEPHACTVFYVSFIIACHHLSPVP